MTLSALSIIILALLVNSTVSSTPGSICVGNSTNINTDAGIKILEDPKRCDEKFCVCKGDAKGKYGNETENTFNGTCPVNDKGWKVDTLKKGGDEVLYCNNANLKGVNYTCGFFLSDQALKSVYSTDNIVDCPATVAKVTDSTPGSICVGNSTKINTDAGIKTLEDPKRCDKKFCVCKGDAKGKYGKETENTADGKCPVNDKGWKVYTLKKEGDEVLYCNSANLKFVQKKCGFFLSDQASNSTYSTDNIVDCPATVANSSASILSLFLSSVLCIVCLVYCL